MVVDIALGIVLAVIILAVGGALLSGVLHGLFAVIAAPFQWFDEFEAWRKRSSWRSRNPSKPLPQIGPALVEMWCGELEDYARDFDGSRDYFGDQDPPEEWDLMRASDVRELAKWLRTNATKSPIPPMPENRVRRWLEEAEIAHRSEVATAERLDDPALHWHAVDSAAVRASLLEWLRSIPCTQQAPKRAAI
jgi:hypothetical protein